MRPRKQYAVLTLPNAYVAHDAQVPADATFKTVNWKPRYVLDLRYMGAGTSPKNVVDAIRRYEARKTRLPDRIRLSEAAASVLGNPTELFAIKVTR